jgi:hypothetical protein
MERNKIEVTEEMISRGISAYQDCRDPHFTGSPRGTVLAVLREVLGDLVVLPDE